MHKASIDFEGREYSIETGRFAKFANGSVMVRAGDTMVLVTTVASNKANDELDYLPLQVEYREKSAAAGKFPGGFLKREGRPSEHEILNARLIDRPIRPLIPSSWRFETQIIATVFSADPEVEPDTLAALGASAALMLSDIPFNGPISEVKIARIDGEFVVNPSFEQLKISDVDITVAGTDSSIVMVEGECKEISEETFVEILLFAHSKIKELNALQMKLYEQYHLEKREFEEYAPPEDFCNFIKEIAYDDMKSYVHTVTTKEERGQSRTEIYEKTLEKVIEKFEEKEEYIDFDFEKNTENILQELEKEQMRNMILDEKRRLDGRGLEDIRKITCDAGVLPRAHGSALFTRGETQSLTTTTLGTKHDEQMIDGLKPVYTNKFLLHYNFPPFSTGEVGRLTGVGRREIGHGNLAERALKSVLPDPNEFPYTIRVVSDILESNGSSSMATVCAGCLSLLDAGVPIEKSVAGIAMGLIKEEDRVAVLSDILGDEDHLGDMDFKVTGTSDGITACQMDIKIEGLSVEIMQRALEQAKAGRMHILSIMNETLHAPREELSKYAPRFTIITIPQDQIGAVIGTGGETIRSIVKESGADVDISEDGTVTIAATSQDSSDEAVRLIENTIRKPEEGVIYPGTVKEIKEGIGAIVEFLPKKQGLLHISQIAHTRTENVSDELSVGEKIEVKLIEITRDGKFRLSRKALIPRPDGVSEEESDSRRRSPSARYGKGSDSKYPRQRK
ncbi:MAG: polyribonucleotide nucleotidyltransferase [Ignavibacteria bacterium]|nr:polyribonucleotide nucleotidyltransferase [Ignavibacteria bacterium]